MAGKPSEIVLDEDGIEESVDENDQEIIEVDKISKKNLKPGQKAVIVRRKIEEHLERKWMRDYYGIELEE